MPVLQTERRCEQMIGMIGREKFYLFRYVSPQTMLVQSRIYEVHQVTPYYLLSEGSVQERLDLLFMLNLNDGQLGVGDL